MFERELVDALFIQRWSIVRTLMPQSIAEHTFLVAHYANDIAVSLGLEPKVHLALLQYTLHHDSREEIFTGDLPGPNKRGLLDAIGPEAKEKWDGKLMEWADRVFANLRSRMGKSLATHDAYTVLLILKTADWLEAAIRMATETQMGNQNAERHIVPNMNGAIETAEKLAAHLTGQSPLKLSSGEGGNDADSIFMPLKNAITKAVLWDALKGASLGPWITREDDSRTYHDPCVDSTHIGVDDLIDKQKPKGFNE